MGPTTRRPASLWSTATTPSTPRPGTYGICSVNAFQAETAEVQDWQREHPYALLRRNGDVVVDKRWHEPLVDTSPAAKRTAIVGEVGRRIDECASRGYRAVELDNLDPAQKNAAVLIARGRALGLDFAVAEEGQVYDACGRYTDVYGTTLVEIEYTDTPPAAFTQACARRTTTASVVLRDRDVAPADVPAHVERWCPRGLRRDPPTRRESVGSN